MSAFWEGFFKAARSRLVYDGWLIVVGFSVGVCLARGDTVYAVIYAALAVFWLWLSHQREKNRKQLAFMEGQLKQLHAEQARQKDIHSALDRLNGRL